jgi:hypothetical protein
MARLSSFFRGLFSFLGTHTAAEDRVAAYVIREHRRGRRLAEILDDAYVKNRLTPQQCERLLDREDVIHALGHDEIEAVKAS